MGSAADIVSQLLGWLYFSAWSISFYPQLWENYKRKSVVGLSLDFVFLNITGYVAYTIFNVSTYFSPKIQDDYFATEHSGSLPVKINDVAFSIHGLILTVWTGYQCLIYERGVQKISKFCVSAIIGCWIYMIIIVSVGLTGHLNAWQTVLYISYAKIFITCTKYVPQAFLNFKRKSTIGWSLGNVQLDFLGGILSLAQMFVDCVSSGSWSEFTGNIPKMLLGQISVAFDILFLVQHYILYPHTPYSSLSNESSINTKLDRAGNDVEHNNEASALISDKRMQRPPFSE